MTAYTKLEIKGKPEEPEITRFNFISKHIVFAFSIGFLLGVWTLALFSVSWSYFTSNPQIIEANSL